ncbi:sensor domain-containing protein [Nocardia sp. CDC159]|uniref:histidine kinase n=1 Tax=Nocardia pulmonis TaxID=2951408 RepID=A0A9X2EHX8_9NOCA|nr:MULTISPECIES: sensor histidine kinase [Nocardia]MCM6778983.1 sensor domain-containing protein [Nocardia pulmonis]MCM6791878.1 sensor domain-containing protein [Nocardia sp. CDC159]
MTYFRRLSIPVRRRVSALWPAIRYLLIGGATSMLAILVVCGLAVEGALCLIGVGVPAVTEVMRLIRWLAGFERRRAGRELGESIVEPYRPLTGSLGRRVVTVLTDPASFRDISWLILHAATGPVAAALAVGLPIDAVYKLVTSLLWQHIPAWSISDHGFAVNSWSRAVLNALIAIPVGVLALQLPRLARLQALMARWLLTPTRGARLADRVAELSATRAAALDAHAAELRRIERDLHDGTQARLAAVIMQLGIADQLHDRDPQASRDLIRTGQDTATTALTELRQVVRSIYPPVLSDRGLEGAVSALAARCPIPCTIDLNNVGRRPAAVEAAVYFVIAETLANATKHSAADHISLSITGTNHALSIVIRDNGIGGACEHPEGGLAGIRRRVEAFDGEMTLTSAAGGPTVVRVELPCGS